MKIIATAKKGKKKGKYPTEPMRTQSKNSQTAESAGKLGGPIRVWL